MSTQLSVITICFNNLQDLVFTCKSVDEQSAAPFEHLVIDGSSNNEILQWLESNQQPGYRRWIHERDQGISDAFNKGIRNAKGNLTHLLNSGDGYKGIHTIEKVVAQFEKDPSLMWLHSRYVQHRGNMDVVSGVAFDKNKLWRGMRTVAHPSMFIKKEVYDRHGMYNTNLKIAMDYDMLVRMRDEKNKFIPEALVYFAPGGASNVQFKKGLEEVRKSHTQYIGPSTRQKAWQLRQRLLQRFMETSMGKRWFRWKNKQ